MPKYHLSFNGPRKCTAKIKECPLGENSEHFSTEIEALAAFEEKMEKEHDTVSSQSKGNQSEYVGVEFEIEDTWGDRNDFTGGVLNEESKNIFRNGQCLALATELSKELGTERVAVLYSEDYDDDYFHDDDGYLLNEDNYDYEYDEDGAKIKAPTTVEVKHFYAVDSNGDYWDVDGKLPKEDLHNNENILNKTYRISEETIDDAEYLYSGDLPEQDYEFANSVVFEVKKAKGEGNTIFDQNQLVTKEQLHQSLLKSS